MDNGVIHRFVPARRRAAAGASRSRSKNRGRIGTEGVLQLILGVGGLTILVPFLFALSVSLRTDGQWLTDPLALFPNPVTWSHFELVLTSPELVRWTINTLIIVVGSVAGAVLSCALVAYPLARIEFRGRNVVFVIVLATMMMPPQVLMVPQYLIFFRLGWIDTFLPLIVPSYFALSGVFVFLFRQHFRSIPKELEDAAHVDGAGHFGTFVRIFLPLSRGPIAVAAILHVIGTYNDFFTPLIYLHSPERQTLATGIVLFGKTMGGTVASIPTQMAVAVLYVAPLLIFFVVVHKHITKGINIGSAFKG